MSIAFLRPATRDVTFSESEAGYRLIVDLHGLAVHEITVSAQGEVIVVEGIAQTHPSEDRDDGVSSSSLRVCIRLPQDADRRTISWRGAAGLLVLAVDRLAYRHAA